MIPSNQNYSVSVPDLEVTHLHLVFNTERFPGILNMDMRVCFIVGVCHSVRVCKKEMEKINMMLMCRNVALIIHGHLAS